MRKQVLALIACLAAVVLVAPPAQASTFKLKLTVIQSDGVVKVFDDEDRSKKGLSKNCMSGPILWNPEPYSVASILFKGLVKGGTKIKVLGASGQTVGVGKITSATFVQTGSYEDEDPEIGSVLEGYCRYSATVSVGNSKFYEILVGGLEGLDVSQTDLKKRKWSYSIKVSN